MLRNFLVSGSLVPSFVSILPVPPNCISDLANTGDFVPFCLLSAAVWRKIRSFCIAMPRDSSKFARLIEWTSPACESELIHL